MANKLERLMKEDGWELGFWVNWGVKYWSFRRDGFEIMLRDISNFDKAEFDSEHFKKWRRTDDN